MALTRPKNIKTYFAFLDSCVEQRIKDEEKVQQDIEEKVDVRIDMFHHIFHAKDTETGNTGYSKGELTGENDLLVIAGYVYRSSMRNF